MTGMEIKDRGKGKEWKNRKRCSMLDRGESDNEREDEERGNLGKRKSGWKK